MTLGLLFPPPLPMLTAFGREPTSSMSEAVLVRGYASVGEIARPCRCGRLIRTLADDDSIARAVRTHNDTPGHTSWATAAGWR